MKTTLVIVGIGIISCSNLSKAQLTINNTGYTPTTLVTNLLLPGSSTTSVSNIVFQGVLNQSSRYQVGAFTTASTTQTQMGFSSGILLTSGNTSEIPLTLGTDPRTTQVSRNYVSCTSGEVRKGGTCPTVINDLNILAGTYNYYNTAILEFDFVAAGSAVSFRYIFGSEEYQDNSGLINYQCSDYNDRFGFLLSGTGISGGQGFTNDAKNIARLANGSIVSINGVNNGVVGSSGGGPAASKCLASNPGWTNGVATAEFLGTIDGTQMNGNTRVLTAYQSGLTPGATYHIKLIVMDINDGAYDSAVYLEGGSFTSEATPLPVDLESFSGFCNESGIELNWLTTSERNNDFFTLERFDKESSVFEPIYVMDAKGNSGKLEHYSYSDGLSESGINIYRLSQTDMDGQQKELKTIAVNQSCLDPKEFVATFNEEGQICIAFHGNRKQASNVKLFDLNGKLLLEETMELNPDETVKLAPQSNLDNGIYLLKVATDNTFEEFKLVKSK